MLSTFLGQMAMTIYNQTYGTSTILKLLERYQHITDAAIGISVINAVLLTIKSLAAGIVVLTYLIDLSGKVTEKNFSTQQFFSATLRLIVAYWFVMYSDVIVGYLMDIGTAAAGSVNNTVTGLDFFDDGANKQKFIDGISKMKVTEILGYIVSCILPWLLSMLGEAILQIIMISRILEIVVMTALAPLSISDIYRSGTSSSGVRFMKKILALGLQVAVIIMINIATQAIVSEIVGAGAAQTLTQLLKEVTVNMDKDPNLAPVAVFSTDSIQEFLNNLTGRGETLKVLGIMLARVGLIWNSLPLCEEITGAR